MSAISALHNVSPRFSRCPSSALVLVIIITSFVVIIVLRRRHESSQMPTPASPPSMTEQTLQLETKLHLPPLALRSSTAPPLSPLPLPTIRRSSYPPPDDKAVPYDSKMGQKRHTLAECSLSHGITRRDTVEEIHGCRRHVMILGVPEDVEGRAQL